jgi:peptidoglycan/xylan/chitin deacetylase (PgdA/CDA1 family)
MLNAIIKSFLGSIFEYLGLSSTLTKQKDFVLMYHRVLENYSNIITQPGMFVSKKSFILQLDYMKSHFDIIPLQHIINNPNHSNTPRCAITFDDGWLDNYTCAYPILKKYNIPATIFPTVSLIGTNQWLWPEKIYYLLQNSFKEENALKVVSSYLKNKTGLYIQGTKSDKAIAEIGDMIISKIKGLSPHCIDDFTEEWAELLKISFPQARTFLNWDQVEEMSNHGIAFGAHGMSHRILIQLTEEEKEREIADCYKILKKAKVNLVPIFAYPNGDYDEETLNIVKRSGYSGAVTTHLGYNNSHTNPYLLKRIGVHQDISNTPSLFSYLIMSACISH